MGIFDPQATVNVTPPAPTQAVQPAPSALSGFASLLGTAMEGYGAAVNYRNANGPSESSINKAQDQARMVGFSNGLNEVQQLRAQGLTAEADARQRQLMINATRDGLDLSSGEVKAVFESTTGQSADFMTLTPEQSMVAAEMQSPEFRSAYMATYATLPGDATEEQRIEAAFTSSAMAGANVQALTSSNFNYRLGGRAVIDSVIADFNNTSMGTLSVIAEQGGVVPIQLIDGAEAQWGTLKSQILATRGDVDDNAWKSTQAQLDAIDAQFTTIRNISGAAGENGISARMTQGVQAYVQSKVDDGSINEIQGNALLTMMTDPTILQGLNIIDSTQFVEMARAADIPEGFKSSSLVQLGDPVTDTRELDDPGNPDNIFSQEMLDQAQDVDGLELLDQAKIISGQTVPMIVDRLSDPSMRNSAAAMISKGLTAVYQSAGQGYASRQRLDDVFNGNLVQAIDEIGKYDPAMAETLSEQAFYALDAQRAAQTQVLLNASDRLSVVSYDEENNKWMVDWASVARVNNMDSAGVTELRRIAGEHYGGDVAAMVQDRGAAYYAAEGNLPNTALMGLLEATDDDVRLMREMDQMLATVRNTEVKLGAFQTRIGEYQQDDPEAPQPGEVQVSTLPQSPISPDSMTGQLLDRYEAGSGGYDALFGQSQNSEFAGTRVSEMTIGQVLEFQSARGEGSYGSYVQANNPEGDLATPAGRYQFVGTTLKGIVEKYGIDPNARFSPELQDALFMVHARDVMSGLATQSAKRDRLRATWAGLKNATNGELDTMIAEIEAGDASAENIIAAGIEGTSPTAGVNVSSLVDTAMGQQASGANAADRITEVATSAAPAQPVAPVADSRAEANTTTPEAQMLTQAAQEAETGDGTSEAAAQSDVVALRRLKDIPVGQVDARISRQVRALGGGGDTPVFQDVNEALDAIYAGEVGMGDVIVIGDSVQVIEE